MEQELFEQLYTLLHDGIAAALAYHARGRPYLAQQKLQAVLLAAERIWQSGAISPDDDFCMRLVYSEEEF